MTEVEVGRSEAASRLAGVSNGTWLLGSSSRVHIKVDWRGT